VRAYTLIYIYVCAGVRELDSSARSTLQRTATHRDALQHSATHCVRELDTSALPPVSHPAASTRERGGDEEEGVKGVEERRGRESEGWEGVEEEEMVALMVDRAYGEGDEVWSSYGPLDKSRQLLFFGFVA